jgi:hypothetical protein
VMGYIRHLPPEYQGPRHLVIRDRLPWNSLGGVSTSGKKPRGQRQRITRQAAWANIAR